MMIVSDYRAAHFLARRDELIAEAATPVVRRRRVRLRRGPHNLRNPDQLMTRTDAAFNCSRHG